MNLFGFGLPELLLILFVLLLFFGKDKLPDLAKSIGKSMRELKDGFSTSLSDRKDDKKEGSKKS